ncbi:unnamed protein product, partial [Didymodactylos carnosus]
QFEQEFNPKNEEERLILFEIGCGTGNFIFPLVEQLPKLYVYACDFSSRAIQLVKSNEYYDTKRICAFVCDLTADNCCDIFHENIREQVDIVSMVFVLSAIHPDKMKQVLNNVYNVLKPNGCILFRDYGLHDYAMLRFSKQRQHKLENNFYVRQDGTRAYFFSLNYIEELFQSSNFDILENCYIFKDTINIKENVCVPRVFVQGKFRKKTINSQLP